MTKDYNKPASTATLTEQELFLRFLDAPLRRGPASTLLRQREEGDLTADFTAEQCFYNYYIAFCDSCLETELPEKLLSALKEVDEPFGYLDGVIQDLKMLLSGMFMLQTEFNLVMESTRTEKPEEDAPDGAFKEWYKNPRYVLPVIENLEEAA
jgi:hypothetical protein